MSTWSGVAEAYRTSFATMCAGSVDRLLADLGRGSLLDVGTGTGELALRSGADRVVAVDADPDMVAVAREVLPGPVLQAALPRLPFGDGRFDSTAANFVVNHVADPRAAVAELARVTRPGGRVAMTVWTSRPPAWGALVGEALEVAGAASVAGGRLPEHLDFERSEAGLAGLARGAGLSVLVAEELTWSWEVEAESLWRGITGGVGMAGQRYLAQPAAVRAAADAAYRDRVSRDHPDGRLRLGCVAAYVAAEVTSDGRPA